MFKIGDIVRFKERSNTYTKQANKSRAVIVEIVESYYRVKWLDSAAGIQNDGLYDMIDFVKAYNGIQHLKRRHNL